MIVRGTTTSAIGIARRGASRPRTVDRRMLSTTSRVSVLGNARAFVRRASRGSPRDGAGRVAGEGRRGAHVVALVAPHAWRRCVHRDAGARPGGRGAARTAGEGLRLGGGG